MRTGSVVLVVVLVVVVALLTLAGFLIFNRAHKAATYQDQYYYFTLGADVVRFDVNGHFTKQYDKADEAGNYSEILTRPFPFDIYQKNSGIWIFDKKTGATKVTSISSITKDESYLTPIISATGDKILVGIIPTKTLLDVIFSSSGNVDQLQSQATYYEYDIATDKTSASDVIKKVSGVTRDMFNLMGFDDSRQLYLGTCNTGGASDTTYLCSANLGTNEVQKLDLASQNVDPKNPELYISPTLSKILILSKEADSYKAAVFSADNLNVPEKIFTLSDLPATWLVDAEITSWSLHENEIALRVEKDDASMVGLFVLNLDDGGLKKVFLDQGDRVGISNGIYVNSASFVSSDTYLVFMRGGSNIGVYDTAAGTLDYFNP